MKIAYVGYDILSDCLYMLWQQGYEIVKLFTIPSGDSYDCNEQVIAFGQKHKIHVQTSPIKTTDIEELLRMECTVMICAGYSFKIPIDIRMRAVNIHPALLPVGRGPWPMPVTILKECETSGVTIHKLTQSFDEGDILLQQEYEIVQWETLLSLTEKIQKTAKELLQKCMANFECLYENAKPQNISQAEYWVEPSEKERNITFQMQLPEMDRRLRAFAGYGCLLETAEGFVPIDLVQFRPIRLSDMKLVNEIRTRYKNTLSAYTFPCIYCWKDLQNLKIYCESDWFVVICGEEDYYFPCGNKNKTEIFLRMLEYRQKVFRLGYISEEAAEFLRNEHAELELKSDRDNFDYLVPVKQIVQLGGKHFHTIRKEIHQFERSGVLETEAITPENLYIVKELAIAWSSEVAGQENAADTLAEECAVESFFKLQMQGVLLKKDKQYFGFVMGTELTENIIDAHFAKCLDKSPGADFYCKQQFCKSLDSRYEYMNIEEDMGIEGIRTRKMLFRPSALTPVYLAAIENKKNGVHYGQQ